MDAATTASKASTGRHSGGWWAWLVGVPLTVSFLLAELWFFAGFLAPGYYASFLFAAGWFVLAMVLLRPVRNRVRVLDRPIRYTYLGTAVVLVFVVALTTFRDDRVDEQVVVAGAGNDVVASGQFVGEAHDPSGAAAVVRVAGGETMLTFTDLATDNGPDLRVYLVAGAVERDSDVQDFRDLGALKGNKGTQQYAVPPEVDLDRYATVVIWCRAFSIAFASAVLASSR